MRMVKERSRLVQSEFVDIAPARRNRVLSESDAPIHFHRHLEAMPVDRGHLRQVVVKHHSHAITLINFDGRAGYTSVESPSVNRAPRSKLGPNDFGNQVEFLNPVNQLVWQLGQVGHGHW